MQELENGTFAVEDEIAPSLGHWFSAQALTNREPEEVTRTSTRSQALPTTKSSSNAAEAPAKNYDELTPTPDVISVEEKTSPMLTVVPTEPIKPTNSALPALLPNKTVKSILILVGTLFGLWSAVVGLKYKNQPQVKNIAPAPMPPTPEGESEFVKDVYGLIRAGETKKALQKLTQFHERGAKQPDAEYLIPYAALLITEKESPSRARKILEGVLSSSASAQMKARAHHWLGYLLLSSDEGDMGENHFLESLQLNPKDPATRFNLGRAYLKLEKYSQALDYLQLAELEAPDLWLVHIYKGRARVSMGNLEEARVAFKTAVQNSPDRWIAYIYNALFLMGVGDQDAAQTALRKMLARDPHYELQSPPPFGYFQEPVNYQEYHNAFRHIMAKASAEDRDLGKLYIEYLQNGLGARESKRIEAMADKGGLFAKVLGLKVVLDRDGSTDELKIAVARLPQNLNSFGYYAYVLRGDARTRLGLFNDAQQDLQKALVLEPKAAVTHWAMATLMKKIERNADSKSELKTLLTYHPDYIPAIVSSQKF